MISVISDTKKPAKLWVKELEADAVNQVRNVANMPFIHNHVAVMPDAHYGKGATVGTVIATYGAIIPAAVGVDIGGGMNCLMVMFQILARTSSCMRTAVNFALILNTFTETFHQASTV